MNEKQLRHLVGLADDLRRAQRAYMGDRSAENGKAVGKAATAYDDVRKLYDDGLGDPRVTLVKTADLDLAVIERALYDWANSDDVSTLSVVELILSQALKPVA